MFPTLIHFYPGLIFAKKAKVEVTNSGKHSSILQCSKIYLLLSFIVQALVAKIIISLSILLVVSMLLKVDIYGCLR